jgi:Meiotically up-regulated gene 113
MDVVFDMDGLCGKDGWSSNLSKFTATFHLSSPVIPAQAGIQLPFVSKTKYNLFMRERILSEIRRIAEASGGQPPGMQVFQNESSIRKHEWMGKYWARWSDAVNEAGFSANEFQQKLDLSTIFPKLALAIRRYKREPTAAEFEMMRNADSDYPSYRSVIGQFESKSDLMRALKNWAETTEGFSDCANLLPDYLQKQSSRTGPLKEGHVYLIKSGAFYKIGRGDELEKRVKQIRTALPDASVLEHSIRTDDPSGIEAYWHRRFADKRANGEWFKLTLQDVTAFKKRKYQ